MKKIASINNADIKRLKILQQKSRERKKQACFVVEGLREVQRAHAANYDWDCIMVHENAPEFDLIKTLQVQNTPIYSIASDLFEKISIRSGTEKIIGIAKNKQHPIAAIQLPENPLVIVIEAPEKPGNIGAILRTVAATNIDAVFVANPKTDLYNPNIIRSSLGGLFSIPIAQDTSENIITFLKSKKFTIAAAAITEKNVSYCSFEYPTPCAIVLGSEADGLTKIWLENADTVIKIPMNNRIDSLNLSVSAGILIYEALRHNNRFSLEDPSIFK